MKLQLLHNSEAMYRLIIQNMMDMVRVVDIHGLTLYASPSHQKNLGYSPEQYVEQQIFVHIVHPQDRAAASLEFQEMLRTKQPRSLCFRVTHADGRTIYLEEQGTPVRGDNDELEYILIHSRDVTEKILAEQALQESEAKYRRIAENMTDIVSVVDMHCNIGYASPAYKKVLGYDESQLLGTSANDYVHPDDLDRIRMGFSELVKTKENRQARMRYIHAAGFSVDVDILGTPLLNENGEVDGVVLVARDITEKVRMERELAQSEQRYRRLMDLSPQPMASHRNGSFIYVNPAAIHLLGAKDAGEIIGRSLFDIVHPAYARLARKRAKTVVEKKYVATTEYKVIRLDGQFIEVEVTGIYDEKTEGTLVVFNDITERKKIERALVQSEERYRRLVELSSVAIGIYTDNKFQYVNPAAMRILGANGDDDVKGTALLDWVHPQDYDAVKGRIETSIKEGNGCRVECRLVRLDGKIVDIAASSIYDTESSAIQLMFEDITARKEAEQALLESEELNRRLIELSPQAIAFHCDYEYHLVNPAGIELLGASSSADLIGRSIFDSIHPDYRDQAKTYITDIYEYKENYPLVEQQLVRADGTIIDVEAVATAIPYKGRTAGLTLIRDITDRKKAEEDRRRAVKALRESEERYFLLQTSLDRFSHDLIGVMKVSEMEQRFVQEVQAVLNTPNVSLINVGRDREVVLRGGSLEQIPAQLLEKILASNLHELAMCEINYTQSGCFLKIGEIRGSSYMICIGGNPSSLQITPTCVWLNTITRYVSVLYDSFRLIEDLTKELEQTATRQVAPSWLLRFLFNLAENERKRLSQDLHDAALQEQIIWYRKLDQLANERSVPIEIREQLQLITQGLLDVVYQIRITCNELRPPMLREQGLVGSLEALFEFMQIRTDYSIQFHVDDFNQALSDMQLIGIYRIVQELLANATKHSKATQVILSLSSEAGRIHLHYEDNGVGMDISAVAEESYSRMGVYGMKERVRSMDGKMEIHSSPNQGLSVFILIPIR